MTKQYKQNDYLNTRTCNFAEGLATLWLSLVMLEGFPNRKRVAALCTSIDDEQIRMGHTSILLFMAFALSNASDFVNFIAAKDPSQSFTLSLLLMPLRLVHEQIRIQRRSV